MVFSRKIHIKDNILKFNTNYDNYGEFYKEQLQFKMNNCHWGQIKLFYSELEFLLLVSKYINIDECLILYVGAADGFRLKHLFIKSFFPNIKMLLYDPKPFRIEESEQIIIKTGTDGFFSDDKIDEVLKIANNRKLLFISDIRISDEDKKTRESIIYDNIMEQQRWGIMMNAEFMLLKFRMFFYNKDPNEIDFINNNYINDQRIKDKIIYKENTEKHKDIHNWMLHLSGQIYTQIFAPIRSTETRLFVKKIKYYKNAKKYNKEDQDKYKMKYYSNIHYDGLLNYFTHNKRNKEYVYKKSNLLVKYIPGSKISYSSASEYYLIRKYLIYVKQKPLFKNILNIIIDIYLFFNINYKNNLIECILKNCSKMHDDTKKNIIAIYMNNNIVKFNEQFKTLNNTKLVLKDKIKLFINSYNISNYRSSYVFSIQNGKITQLYNIQKDLTIDKIVNTITEEYKKFDNT